MTTVPNANTGTRLESCVDYTDLRKEIEYGDVESMCADAITFGFGSVVVPSGLVRRAASVLKNSEPVVGSVLSYPFGTQEAIVKAREAEVAAGHGAAALDLVPHFGAILAENWDSVHAELSAVRSAAGDLLLSLVLEIGRLGTFQIRKLCAMAANCGYVRVVNTVGFRLVSTDPEAEGRASAETIRMLSGLVDGSLEVKAVGGITSRSQIEQLRASGADRFAVDAGAKTIRNGSWQAPSMGDA